MNIKTEAQIKQAYSIYETLLTARVNALVALDTEAVNQIDEALDDLSQMTGITF